MCICISLYMCIVCAHVHVCVCMHVHVCTCMYMYVYGVYAYTRVCIFQGKPLVLMVIDYSDTMILIGFQYAHFTVEEN